MNSVWRGAAIILGLGVSLPLASGRESPPRWNDTNGNAAYSPGLPGRPRLLLDEWYRQGPSLHIGRWLVTGAWAGNLGRYGIDDYSHTNSLDPLVHLLEEEFEIVRHRRPYDEAILGKADILLLICPNHPSAVPETPVISDEDIERFRAFVHNGGSLAVMVNAVGRNLEQFETAQLRKLVRSFGLDWESNGTHYSDIRIGPLHPHFYDVETFHYGDGAILKVIDPGAETEVLVHVKEAPQQPVARGPGIIVMRHGAGKMMLIGDTGSWTGNIARPWVQNDEFSRQLFRVLKRDTRRVPVGVAWPESSYYRGRHVQMVSMPALNPLRTVEQPHHRAFYPRPQTSISLLEAESLLGIRHRNEQDGVGRHDARLEEFRLFEGADKPDGAQGGVSFATSRQGAVGDMDADGQWAEWLAPDVVATVAFLPYEGLRVGDRWRKKVPVRVTPLVTARVPRVIEPDLEMLYVRDEVIEGRDCLVVRTQGMRWLDEIGVSIRDLVGSDKADVYEHSNGRGGQWMFKREQWICRETGRVMRSSDQSRFLLWIKARDEEPLANPGEIDQRRIVVILHNSNWEKVAAHPGKDG